MKGCLTFLLCLLLLLACVGVGLFYLDLLPEGITGWMEPSSNREQSSEMPPADKMPETSQRDGITDAEELSHQIAQGMREYQPSLQVSVQLPSPGVDRESYLLDLVERSYIQLRRNYPEIFWMGMGQYGIQWSNGGEGGVVPLTLELNYSMSAERMQAMEAEIDAVVAQVLAQSPDDPYEAVKYFHDWIINQTVYDVAIAELDIMQGYEHAYNIHGVFLEGQAVCEAYAKAFQLLCNKKGIPASIVFGTSEGESHAWNYVQLDGGWYLVDCTADDPVSDRDILRWNYFLRGTGSVLEDGKTMWDIYVPDNGEYPYLSPYDYIEMDESGYNELYQEHEVYSVELLLAGALKQGDEMTRPAGRIGTVKAQGTESGYRYELSGQGADDWRFTLDAQSGQLYVGDVALANGSYELKVKVTGLQASAVATIRLDVGE